METLNIEQFNPKIAELQTLSQQAREVDLTNLEAVKEMRGKLRDARLEITKTGKAMRDDANAFAKAVIAREKELVSIIEPEEERLKEAEAEAKRLKEREERRTLLPVRHDRLNAIGDGVTVTDDELLEMDGSTFEGYFNKRQADKIEADRAEIARQQAEIDAEKRKQEEEAQRLENEKKAQEREKQAREDAIREERERQEREKAEAEQREREQRERDERAEAERKAKLEADERYQAWLTEIGYVENGLVLREENGVVTAYKIVATFNK